MTDPRGAQSYHSNELRRLMDARTVQILGNGVHGGSGSFIAPGLVLTCAHVVSTDQNAVARRAVVAWNGQQLPGQVQAHPQSSTSDLWPYPDLCVIELDKPVPRHPCVVLGELRDILGTGVYLTGFNGIYDQHQDQFQGKSGELDGPQDSDDGRMWQLKDCEIASGMSGGPVLDLSSGVVCGIAKAQRKRVTTMGGLMIPADALRATFPDAWNRNQRASRDEEKWNECQAELRSYNPNFRLRAEQHQALLRAQEMLRLKRRDLERLWRAIVGDLGPKLQDDLDSLLDLADALTDAPPGELDPYARLFVQLEIEAERQSSHGYLDRAREIAKSRRQRPALRKYLKNAKKDARNDPKKSMPVIVVKLDEHSPHRLSQVDLTVWTYGRGSTSAGQAKCERGPYDVSQLEKIVTGALEGAMRGLGGRPLIEFVLPDQLLDEPVEKWDMRSGCRAEQERDEDSPLLGEDYPVVVRFGSRESEAEENWLGRKREFQNGRTPALGSPDWNGLWVRCGDKRGWRELNVLLGQAGCMPVIGMTAWHSWNGTNTVPAAVHAARHAGASIILWHHSPCLDHARPDIAIPCGRLDFPGVIAQDLADVEFQHLPKRIREVRLNSVKHLKDKGYPGHGIALLWDDPSRRPWTEPLELQGPSPSETDA